MRGRCGKSGNNGLSRVSWRDMVALRIFGSCTCDSGVGRTTALAPQGRPYLWPARAGAFFRPTPRSNSPTRSRCILAALTLAAVFAGAAPGRAETAYVSDEVKNVLHVIDGAALKEVAAIPVGRRPRGLVLSRDGNRLYVAEGDDDRIDVVDLASRRVVDHIPSGRDPERFAVSPDGRRFYVANEDGNTLSIIDIGSKRILAQVRVGPEPEGVAVSPDGKLVVCTSEGASLVHFIDVAAAKLMTSFLVGTRPRDALFTEGGRRLWVSSERRATITVFDPSARKQVATIDFEKADPPPNVQAVQMVMTHDGSRVYVGLGRGNHVAEVDARTYKVLRYFPAGFRDWNLALSPDERRVYTANGLSGDVSVIDLRSGKTAATIKVGGQPWGVVVSR